ncbi:hypothetical protein PISMIDRAFT_313511 [Pisolithus microcarpus 441]|uniref:Uncharacterized protein n=1 Tax=Pisolithus microcarpus 441 TaxID=765257 RepID=A0A0D0AFC6_9AGAM|nr:hypothetical protein PISMIDRAFT_313511 [Pisolithus microcarpus 441]
MTTRLTDFFPFLPTPSRTLLASSNNLPRSNAILGGGSSTLTTSSFEVRFRAAMSNVFWSGPPLLPLDDVPSSIRLEVCATPPALFADLTGGATGDMALETGVVYPEEPILLPCWAAFCAFSRSLAAAATSSELSVSKFHSNTHYNYS